METLELPVTESGAITATTHRIVLGAGKPYSFKPGQYCTMELKLASGSVDEHDFSICNSPGKSQIEFATRVSDSDYKKAFVSLKKGDSVKLVGPFGKFVLDESLPEIVFLSGGIGITPIRSMLEYASEKKLPGQFTLLFGNRSLEDIPFKPELDALVKTNQNFKIVHVLQNAPADWQGYTGLINADLLKKEIADLHAPTYYICGPPGMVDALRQLLTSLDVPDAKVKFENFTGYK